MVRSTRERSRRFYAFGAVWIGVTVWLVRNDLTVLAVFGSLGLALWHFGLRDKFASETTDSAYNVFNRGGRSILGGFTGEQLEGQLRGNTAPSTTTTTQSARDDDDRPLVSLSSSSPKKASDKDKLRRRAAAAAAAERRMQHQQYPQNQ